MKSQSTTSDKKPEATAPGSRILGSSSGSNANLLTLVGHAASVDALSESDSTFASGNNLHPTGLHFREGSGNARKAKAAVGANASDGNEELLLLPHTYPPSQRGTFSDQTATLQYHEIQDSGDHAPISAPTVFSRYAAPLSLPQLDKYISSLSIPAFSLSSRTEAGTKRDRFVPFDRLAKTGRSIESLETNIKTKPAWRNCKSILSGLVNIVLGILVSRHLSAAYSTGYALGVKCSRHVLQCERLVRHCPDICSHFVNDRYVNQSTAPCFPFFPPSSSS
jgi:hypothetical protein